MRERNKTEQEVKFFVVSDSPKIYSIPDEVVFPVFFVDFPLLKSGVRHLFVKDENRYSVSTDGKIRTVVRNPLTPPSFKLLLLLLGQKQQEVKVNYSFLTEGACS